MTPPAVGVIIAGGRGTRMGPLSATLPKALVDIGGRPLLGRHLDELAAAGVDRVFVLAGHLADRVTESLPLLVPRGVHVEVLVETEPLGTAGALTSLPPGDGSLIVVLGDVLVHMDLAAVHERHRRRSPMATVVVHPNDHPQDSDLVELDAQGRISAWHLKPHDPDLRVRNMVAAGVYVLDPLVCRRLTPGAPADLSRDLLAELVAEGVAVDGHVTTEYVKDAGTPERLERVRVDWDSGIVAAARAGRRRPTAFVDRDGTLLRPVGYLTRPEEVELLPGAGSAVAALNRAGFLVVVVTNQPQLAHGLIDEDDLSRLHAELDHQLGRAGAFVDAILHCPHHPDATGEAIGPHGRPCTCRKPRPGLLHAAMAELAIDPDDLVVFGDTWRDEQAAAAIGATFVRVDPNDPGASLAVGVERVLGSRSDPG